MALPEAAETTEAAEELFIFIRKRGRKVDEQCPFCGQGFQKAEFGTHVLTGHFLSLGQEGWSEEAGPADQESGGNKQKAIRHRGPLWPPLCARRRRHQHWRRATPTSTGRPVKTRRRKNPHRNRRKGNGEFFALKKKVFFLCVKNCLGFVFGWLSCVKFVWVWLSFLRFG